MQTAETKEVLELIGDTALGKKYKKPNGEVVEIITTKEQEGVSTFRMIDVENPSIISVKLFENNEERDSNAKLFTLTNNRELRIKIHSGEMKRTLKETINKVFLELQVDQVVGTGSLRCHVPSSGSSELFVELDKEIIQQGISVDMTTMMQLNLEYVEVVITTNDLSCEIHSNYHQEEETRPRIRIEYYDEEGELERVEKTYSVGRSGETAVHVWKGSFTHKHYDTSIQENALGIDIEHLYQSKVAAGKSIDKVEKHLGTGWKTNLHQYIVEEENHNKLLEGKVLTYLDGQGIKHDFLEQWYYLESGEKQFVAKSDVYIGWDQTHKVKIENKEYSALQEIKTKDGLTLVSRHEPIARTEKKTIKRKIYYVKFGFGNVEINFQKKETHKFQYYFEYQGKKRYVTPTEIQKEIDGTFYVYELMERRKVKLEEEETTILTDHGWYFECKKTIDQNTEKHRQDLVIEEMEEEFYLNEELENVEEQLQNVEEQLQELNHQKNNLEKNYQITITQEEVVKSQVNLSKEMTNFDKKMKEKENYFYHHIPEWDPNLINETEPKGLGTKAVNALFKALGSGLKIDRGECEIHDEPYIQEDMSVEQAKAAMDAYSLLVQEYTREPKKVFDQIQTTLQKQSLDLNEVSVLLSKGDQKFQLETIEKRIKNARKIILRLEEQKKQILSNIEKTLEKQNQEVNYVIMDQEGNTLGFDGYGRLIVIVDQFENEIQIQYGTKETQRQILNVISKHQRVNFLYHKTTKLLEFIIDNRGLKTEFQYDGSNLVRIIYPNGDITVFDYENGFQVTSPLKQRTKLTVEEHRTTDVYTYCYGGVINGEKLQTETFENLSKDHYEYEEFSTMVHNDRRDEDEIYYFSGTGKPKQIEGEESMVFQYFHQEKLQTASSCKKEMMTVYDTVLPIKSSFLSETHDVKALMNKKKATSNLLGLQIDVGVREEDYHPNVKIEVLVKTTTKEKDGSIQVKETNMNYEELLLETIVLPIVIDCEKTTKLEYQITTNGTDYYVRDYKIIPLETGVIYTYEGDRLVKEEDGHTETQYFDFVEHVPTRKVIKEHKTKKKVTVWTTYNTFHQMTSEETSEGFVTRYDYDEKGQLLNITEFHREEPSLVRSEQYQYDEFGNVSGRAGKISKNGETPKEEITYFPNTNQVQKVKGFNQGVTSYTYDEKTGDLLSRSISSEGFNNATNFTYQHGLLMSMSHHGVKVRYDYDGKGRIVNTYLNNERYRHTSYYGNQDEFSKTTMKKDQDGFAFYQETQRNKKGQVIQVIQGVEVEGQEKITSKTNHQYQEGNLVESKIQKLTNNQVQEETIKNTYNEFNQIKSSEKIVGGKTQLSYTNTYNEKQQLESQTRTIEQDTQQTLFEYKDDELVSVSLDHLEYQFDKDVLGRMKHEEVVLEDTKFCHEYEYLKQEEHTLDFVREDQFSINGALEEITSYEYDEVGNITRIELGETEVNYQYDKLNRLVKEENEKLGKTIHYKYDTAGNILKKQTYLLGEQAPKVDRYSYTCSGWKDQLTSWNGERIEYDPLGRPVVYRNQDMIWSPKGELTCIETEEDIIEYEYNVNGIRTSKLVEGQITEFIVNGSKILKLKRLEDHITFHYVLDKLVGFTYNKGTTSKDYLYRRNIQGDIIGIYHEEGTLVGEYVYDGFGNHKITVDKEGIATINPFRYRGYFYDEETGFYYLNTRYYDPNVGRFLSADDISYLDPESINGLNLYAYCGNNPVMGYDPNGNWNWGRFFVGVGIGLAAVGAIALVALTCGAAAPIIAGAIAAGSINIISQGSSNGYKNIDWGEVGVQTISGAFYGAAAMVGGLPGMLLKAGIVGLTQTAMGIYQGKSAGEIIVNTVLAFGISMGIQGFMKIPAVSKLLNKGMNYLQSKVASFFGDKMLMNMVTRETVRNLARIDGNMPLNYFTLALTASAVKYGVGIKDWLLEQF